MSSRVTGVSPEKQQKHVRGETTQSIQGNKGGKGGGKGEWMDGMVAGSHLGGGEINERGGRGVRGMTLRGRREGMRAIWESEGGDKAVLGMACLGGWGGWKRQSW